MCASICAFLLYTAIKVQISSQIQTSMAETTIFKPLLGGNHCDFADCMNQIKSTQNQARTLSVPVI